MFIRIAGIGTVFFLILAGLWQLMWHKDIYTVSQLLNADSFSIFFGRFTDMSHISDHLSGKQMGIFFTIFVMLQFWNLFNAKYYKTDRSLILDIADAIRKKRPLKESFSPGFFWISLVIVLGQVIIVTFAGKMFSVDPLTIKDWILIMLITSPVLLVADIFRTVRQLIKNAKA